MYSTRHFTLASADVERLSYVEEPSSRVGAPSAGLSGHVEHLATLYSWPQEYEKRVMVLLINYRWEYTESSIPPPFQRRHTVIIDNYEYKPILEKQAIFDGTLTLRRDRLYAVNYGGNVL